MQRLPQVDGWMESEAGKGSRTPSMSKKIRMRLVWLAIISRFVPPQKDVYSPGVEDWLECVGIDLQEVDRSGVPWYW